MKAKKCSFANDQVLYLGHIISADGIQVDVNKVKSINDLAPPSNVSELRTFLGLVGYYRRFVPGFASTARPLYDLLQIKTPWCWDSIHHSAWLSLKNSLLSPLVLRFPDFNKPFYLFTDASLSGFGAILAQTDANNRDYIIACASRTLTSSELKYDVRQLEAFAVVWAAEYFRHYLIGSKFIVVTDHEALKWLKNIKTPGHLMRWSLRLEEFDFDIVHRKGSTHLNADALSRLFPVDAPCPVDFDDAPDRFFAFPTVRVRLSDRPMNPSLADIARAQKNAVELQSFIERAIADDPDFTLDAYDRLLFRSRLVIPDALVPNILFMAHSSPSGGHFGFFKTWHRLHKRFWWPRMAKSLREYLNSCVLCQQCKPHRPIRHRLMIPTPVPKAPFEIISIDYLVNLPDTPRGHSSILVVIDHFTKFMVAIPVPDNTASVAANAILSSVVAQFGLPSLIVSDQGRAFDSKLFKLLLEALGIQQRLSTPHHSTGHAQVERTNRTLGNVLRTIAHNDQVNWDFHISAASFAYNSSIHHVTGETPHFALFGREARLPEDILFKRQSEAVLRDPWLKTLRQVHRKLRRQIRKAILHNKQLYDKSRIDVNFKIGDLVLHYDPLRERHASYSKLTQKWFGPYRIVGKRNANSYIIRDIYDSRRAKNVAVDRLRKFVAPSWF